MTYQLTESQRNRIMEIADEHKSCKNTADGWKTNECCYTAIEKALTELAPEIRNQALEDVITAFEKEGMYSDAEPSDRWEQGYSAAERVYASVIRALKGSHVA